MKDNLEGIGFGSLMPASQLESENAALKQELEKLRIQSLDAFDKQREKYEKERDRYKAALEEIANTGEGINLNYIDYPNCFRNMKYVAKEALTPPSAVKS